MPIENLRAMCEAAVQQSVFPAYGVAIGTRESTWVFSGGSNIPVGDQTTAIDDLFDLASLTKVLVTTPRARESLELDAPVCEIWPEFGKPEITTRHLLLHESGLPAHWELWKECRDQAIGWDRLATMPLEYSPGHQSIYSCMGFLVLGHMLSRVGASDPKGWLQSHYGTSGLCFNPSSSLTCLPTENGMAGTVHDENARFFGGVAGNAGLFGSPEAIASVAKKILTEEPSDWTSCASNRSSRALGWDTKSPEGSSCGQKFGPRSFGHTGFTGTSLWVDPDAGIFGALLSNRVNPSRENLRIQEFRPKFYDAVFEALT